MGTEFSLLGAETVSMAMVEVAAVFVGELEVTERLRVMDSDVVEVTGCSAGEALVVCEVEVGRSVAVESAAAALLSTSVTFVGVTAAALLLVGSAQVSELTGVTVLGGEEVTSVELESEIVCPLGALRPGDAALTEAPACVSPSRMWPSSFSGVLRPDAVEPGGGLITGFGSRAGFPVDSCADTLGLI